MSHENEYFPNMVTMLELIWGDGYMAPGGPGNVARLLDGIDTQGKRILDIGCGPGAFGVAYLQHFPNGVANQKDCTFAGIYLLPFSGLHQSKSIFV